MKPSGALPIFKDESAAAEAGSRGALRSRSFRPPGLCLSVAHSSTSRPHCLPPGPPSSLPCLGRLTRYLVWAPCILTALWPARVSSTTWREDRLEGEAGRPTGGGGVHSGWGGPVQRGAAGRGPGLTGARPSDRHTRTDSQQGQSRSRGTKALAVWRAHLKQKNSKLQT